MWFNLLFALLGWLVGYLINLLADYLPARRLAEGTTAVSWPAPALLRLVQGQTARRRPWLVEGTAVLLYAALPALIPAWQNLLVNSVHIAVLLLIIVIDLEHRLIFDVVTYPATALALLGSLIVTPEENSIGLAAVGAVAGFVVFWLLYMLAQFVYGRGSGALGGGDVKLALALGAMLGLHRIFFALALGILLGGVTTLLLLLSRRVGRNAFLPYGQYLAVAGIIMLIWGAEFARGYLN